MKKIILAVAAVAMLAACDSKEQQAAKKFAAAQELVSKGDVQRALVELRNALQTDPNLNDARVLFAQLLAQTGRSGDAISQYRQIVQNNPDNADATRALTLMAFDALAWDDAKKYLTPALTAAPNDPDLQAVKIGLDYRTAAMARNEDDLAKAAAAATALLQDHPDLLRARRVVVAEAIRSGRLDDALAATDAGLAQSPDLRDLNNTRLLILDRQSNAPELEKQLLKMVALYPDDEALPKALVQLYLKTGRVDDAEKTLRNDIKPDSTDPAPRMVLLRFLAEIRSPDVMRTELEKLLAENPLPSDVAAAPNQFRSLLAQSEFVAGQTDKAQADLEGLIKGAEPSQELDKLKVQLAQMRLTLNNKVGARALIEEVLAHDPSQTDAVKINSSWLIEDDKTDQAISNLRDALANAPNDAGILTLLARAYERTGQTELMSDMLARAVDVSRQAPAESLNYARYLLQKEQYIAAETVILDSLRNAPDNLELLATLARTHLAMKDWGRADQDISSLQDRVKTPQAVAIVNELRAQMLSQQGRSADLTQFLEQLARNSGDALGPRLAMIRNMVLSGQMEQALTDAEALAKENPQSPAPQILVAQILASMDKTDDAIRNLQALTTAQPKVMQGWLLLQGLQMQAGNLPAALKTMKAALVQIPDAPALLQADAILLEKNGDIDGAIAVYEKLYAQNSENLNVANNLASLIASTRTDAASLERSWTIARRLNGTTQPAFQDTYGWIAFRRGEIDTALPTLESAAKGLPNDPSVAYHLGRVYAAQNRKDEAKAQYERAKTLLQQGAVGYPALNSDIDVAETALNP